MTLPSRKLIIDTNLLLLVVMGAIENRRHIKTSSRLNSFCEEDYYKIIEIIGGFDSLHITPFIATEVSNLIDLNGHSYTRAMEFAREFFSDCQEVNHSISDSCQSDYFLKFGITDTSLMTLVNEYTILSSDIPLTNILYNIKPDNVLPYFAVK